jgi:hypothetical protein
MRPAKYFYDNPLPNYLDPKTVLIYRPHPVCPRQLSVESAARDSPAKYRQSARLFLK